MSHALVRVRALGSLVPAVMRPLGGIHVVHGMQEQTEFVIVAMPAFVCAVVCGVGVWTTGCGGDEWVTALVRAQAADVMRLRETKAVVEIGEDRTRHF